MAVASDAAPMSPVTGGVVATITSDVSPSGIVTDKTVTPVPGATTAASTASSAASSTASTTSTSASSPETGFLPITQMIPGKEVKKDNSVIRYLAISVMILAALWALYSLFIKAK